MKIRLSDFAHSPQAFTVELPIEKLKEAINTSNINPQSPLSGSLTGSFATDGAMLNGVLSMKISQECGRCTEPKERLVKVPVEAYLRKIPREKHHEHDGRYEDDVGVFFVEDDLVDITPILQELAVMSLTPYWSPTLDGSGVCKMCKVRFETTTTLSSGLKLAELLKKVI